MHIGKAYNENFSSRNTVTASASGIMTAQHVEQHLGGSYCIFTVTTGITAQRSLSKGASPTWVFTSNLFLEMLKTSSKLCFLFLQAASCLTGRNHLRSTAAYFEYIHSAFSSPQIKTKFHSPPQVTCTAKFLDAYSFFQLHEKNTEGYSPIHPPKKPK